MPTRLKAGGLFALVALAACAPQQSAPEPPADTLDTPVTETAAAGPLASSLEVEQFADSVQLVLRVTNASDEPVRLTFPTGQSFDFVVTRDGQEVWRWSGDRMFTQAFRTETIAPGETQSYPATWSPGTGAPAGEYTVQGFLTAQEHRLSQQMTVRLP